MLLLSPRAVGKIAILRTAGMNQTSVRVLLIEDNPDYAELVQQWLTYASDDMNFALSWTDSLAGGLSRLAAGDVDTILLDLGLPDSNGMETYTAAKARAPSLPTIILSTADSESLAIEMVHHGAQDYLVKSNCTAEGLIKAIRFAIAAPRADKKDQRKRVSRSNPVPGCGQRQGWRGLYHGSLYLGG